MKIQKMAERRPLKGQWRTISPTGLYCGLGSWPSDRSFIVYRCGKNGIYALGPGPCYEIHPKGHATEFRTWSWGTWPVGSGRPYFAVYLHRI